MLTKVLPFIHEYIEGIIRKKNDLRYIILYGSIATQNAAPDSDIDLKIRVGSERDIKDIKYIEREINKKIFKAGLKNHISSIISTKDEIEHTENGILLWGTPIKITAKEKDLQQKTIITYDTTSLPQVKRAELVRRLFGYKTKRGKKTYGFNGVFKGKKLRNALLLDKNDTKNTEQILKEFEIPIESTEVFLNKYSNFIEK